jgi:hypothetical protein
MRRAVQLFTVALAAALAVGMRAQEPSNAAKSEGPPTLTYSGCLEAGTDAATYVLSHVTTGKKTSAVVTDEPPAVGTTGIAFRGYKLTPRAGVNLASHVGHEVEVKAFDPNGDVEKNKIDPKATPILTVTEVKMKSAACKP